MSGIERLLDHLGASAPVRAVSLGLTRRRLRVLAYHGIADLDVLDRQLAWLRRHLAPVSAGDVVAALRREKALPANAVWVTFDDGDPSMVDAARVLTRHGIHSTMFVCPGVIASGAPHWWQVVAPADVEALKRLPDVERRSRIAALERAREPGDVPAQLRVDDVRALADAGQDIGNHTWDHPMLDRCDAAEQRRQITDAHEWLTTTLGRSPQAFAYPNGNATSVAADAVRGLGYGVAVMHDHRLADLGDAFSVSRLRVGDDITPDRFAAILAGVHPAIHALRSRRGR